MLQGVKYNIPVAIWLTEQYPQQAPLTYVVPTPDMIIKPRHSFVDASGEKSCLLASGLTPQPCICCMPLCVWVPQMECCADCSAVTEVPACRT